MGRRRTAFRSWAGPLLLALGLSMAGCGGVLDSNLVRMCRLALPAINPDATAIVLVAAVPAHAPYSVRLDYRVADAGGTRMRVAGCGFAQDGGGDPVLTAFGTEEGAFSPIRLHILKRYWLDRDAIAVPADPGPGETGRPALLVSRPVAYLLQALANGLPSTAVMMLVAVAYSLLYGIVGKVNLAFGELAAIGAFGTVAGSFIASRFGIASVPAGLLVSAAIGIGLAMLHGRVIERLVFSRLAFGPGQTIMIATVAIAIVLQNYLTIAEAANPRWVPPSLAVSFPFAGSDGFVATITLTQILVAAMASTLALGLVAAMKWSSFGRSWRAVADDPGMASLMGISPGRTLAVTFMLATAMAGAAGFVATVQYGGAGFAAGTMIGLKGLVAAVLGGIGSIPGALYGGLAIGAFEAVWSAYLPIEQRDLAVLLVLVGVFALRPDGIMGRGAGAAPPLPRRPW